ncbi:MAG: hypothetical protein LC754_04670 [Acidobacteria bacterium]|nr:hypothetical protein [Acidobacteriota bacterium]
MTPSTHLMMKNTLDFFRFFSLLLSISISAWLNASGAQPAAASHISQPPKVLAVETFNLTQGMEVGLEIEAQSPGASWARKGAEASALLISVDGVYNQDLLLWAGEEVFHYRVMLGHLPGGKHVVSVALNTARSAAGAQRAEVKSLRPLLFATGQRTSAADEEQLALAHSPVLYARANTIDRFTDIPLLMYYEILREAGADLTVRYTVIFTNEDGGTQTAALMARWGRATDIEWVYQIRMRNQKIIEETYQGVEHETKFFTGPRTGGSHPLLAVASDNNNFSDLACSAVRFAPLPVRARLETATRESVMDMYPPTYRAMTEELLREKRISDAPADINTIADPREYLYIEAVSEQEGAALAFDVRLKGQSKVFASDMGEPRLRIDRSGYFRTAVRLPRNVSPSAVETITARCHASQKPAGERRCTHLKVIRVLVLDPNYVPRPLPLHTQPESSLAPGETKIFRLDQPTP